MHRRLPTLRPLIQRPGWPKTLRCLSCDRPRRALGPGDRFCDACRERAAELDTGPSSSDERLGLGSSVRVVLPGLLAYPPDVPARRPLSTLRSLRGRIAR